MNYLRFFLSNKRILSFGVLLVFFSSFGQTFVVSLYIPSLMESFQISRSFFSSLYAGATLLSATTLIVLGRRIDHVPLRGFTLFVVAGITAACLVAAFSFNLLTLFLAVYMLRLFGQGLLSHTSMTTMGRFFSRARGKALSIAYLGFPLGEGLMPVVVISTIAALGWRETFGLSALFILLVLLPLSMMLLRGASPASVVEAGTESRQVSVPASRPDKDTVPGEERLWRQRDILRSGVFYLLAPTVFLVGFLQTALFFFQTFIATEKGWSLEWMAAGITAYALSASLCSVFAGPLIDRYSGRRLLPLVLLPLGAGLIVLSLFDPLWATPLFWMLVGITGGSSSPITSAIYAETYGTRSLGTVRSLFTFVMVVSTAAAPVVYSFFLERGLGFSHIHWGVVAVIAANALVLVLLGRRLQPVRTPNG